MGVHVVDLDLVATAAELVAEDLDESACTCPVQAGLGSRLGGGSALMAEVVVLRDELVHGRHL